MAEQGNPNAAKTAARDGQEELEKQVAQLKREISKINRALSERAEEVMEDASGWYDSAADRASRTARQLKSQAQLVSETVQQNPATVGSVFLLGAVLGAMLGVLLGTRTERDRHWY